MHTPTPWTLHVDDLRYVLKTEDGGRMIHLATVSGSVHNPDVKADAEFIHRAVNAHDDMLEALFAVRGFMIPGMNWTDETGKLLKQMVRKAIKKAEVG